MTFDYVSTLRATIAGRDLGGEQTAAMIGELMDGTLSPVRAAALLGALSSKGETSAEIFGAARAMRDRSVRVRSGHVPLVDIVGTGGDHANTLNISTLAALVVAAAGVAVAKHGNRAVSSACGSADVLEAVGFPVDLDPGQAAAMLERTNFTFLFAPRYHPAMRNVAPIRRELGIRTIFNVLGPLTNPARATHCVVGVASAVLAPTLARALIDLGVTRGAVVHGHGGLDEISGTGKTRIVSFAHSRLHEWTVDAEDFNVHVDVAEMRVNNVAQARDAFLRIARGEPLRGAEVVALNAALAFVVCERVHSMAQGFALARAILQRGDVASLLDRLCA